MMFCRHASCWALELPQNKWKSAAPLSMEREQAASVALAGAMVVLGGSDQGGGQLSQIEVAWATA